MWLYSQDVRMRHSKFLYLFLWNPVSTGSKKDLSGLGAPSLWCVDLASVHPGWGWDSSYSRFVKFCAFVWHYLFFRIHEKMSIHLIGNIYTLVDVQEIKRMIWKNFHIKEKFVQNLDPENIYVYRYCQSKTQKSTLGNIGYSKCKCFSPDPKLSCMYNIVDAKDWIN